MLNELYHISINSLSIYVKTHYSILEVSKLLGFKIPRFCYHELLSIAGNCRMCLVELQGAIKPVASCAMPITNGMSIFLDTPLVLKARENILESLLLNHPLDCPICDQAGECDLQDQSKKFGSDKSRNKYIKRVVEDKYISPIINTIMTRCIHCTRCVRFSSEILGIEALGTLKRGGSTEIGNYSTSLVLFSELTGNIIDLCPVGALTSKAYSFKARPWELRSIETIDLIDSLGSNIYIQHQNSNIVRIIPKVNSYLNSNIISDSARFYFDALINQRIYKFYSHLKIISKTQNEIVNTIKQKLFYNCCNKETALFLIDETLDLECIQILKNLSYKFKNKIQCINLSSSNYTNYYNSSLKSKIYQISNKSKNIFILCCNLKIESSILNNKIRNNFISNNTNIVSFLGYNITNFNSFFINLNYNAFLFFIEGKAKKLSINIVKEQYPTFIIGESFYNRSLKQEYINNYLYKLCATSIIFFVRRSCNSIGRDISNILTFSKKSFFKS
jgi:NADH-quinone oxidoreductase subunit G